MRISDWSSDVCSSDLPTEYEFANKHLANWNHWKRLLANVIIRRYIDEWREELELKMKAKAVREMQALVNSENGNFKAAKYRSEEHTSELQSLMRISYAVFCLKKKNKTITRNTASAHE